MDTTTAHKIGRRLGLLGIVLFLSSFATISRAGEFAFTNGSWNNVVTTGSASGLSTQTVADSGAIDSSLSIKALTSGTYTVKADWSYSVTWTPASPTDTAPANVKVTLWRDGTPTVAGTGVAKITDVSSVDLLDVDSTSLWQSGLTIATPDIVVTLPLVAQSDGTYKANGTISSDLISVTYDAATSQQTQCQESFALANMVVA